MLNTKLIDKINEITQIDIDSYHAYTQAIEHIKDPQIRERLSEFRRDHERHVERLSALVQGMGGKSPTFSRDFKGFMISGYTAIRSMISTDGAIKAMIGNEKIPFDAYHQALAMADLPDNVKTIFREHAEDEKKQMSTLEKIHKDLTAS